MDLINSKNITNRIKKSSISSAIVAHAVLALMTLGLSLLLLGITGVITSVLLKKNINEAN